MIKIYKHNHKWRISIVNETLEFENQAEFENTLVELIELKENFEPYK